MALDKSTNLSPDFEALLAYLKQSRGFDITGYKRSSPMRRITKRMRAVGIESFREYQEHLELHPDEFPQLFDNILINVTGFFRDPEAWDFLRQEAVPRLLATKPAREPIRVWSAACSTGEEAYTLAMILAEAVGTDAFRERVKIYATDIDEGALAQARTGVYSSKQVSDVPPELLGKYFDATGSRYAFREDLRRAVIFERNDLTQDPPVSRVDLLTCRNILMYFNAETQARVTAGLRIALNDGGTLMLGRSETLFTQANSFFPVNLKHRIFKRAARVYQRDHVLTLTQQLPTLPEESETSTR